MKLLKNIIRRNLSLHCLPDHQLAEFTHHRGLDRDPGYATCWRQFSENLVLQSGSTQIYFVKAVGK